jgi:hypothetical protein
MAQHLLGYHALPPSSVQGWYLEELLAHLTVTQRRGEEREGEGEGINTSSDFTVSRIWTLKYVCASLLEQVCDWACIYVRMHAYIYLRVAVLTSNSLIKNSSGWCAHHYLGAVPVALIVRIQLSAIVEKGLESLWPCGKEGKDRGV